jgi:hypothetical protein
MTLTAMDSSFLYRELSLALTPAAPVAREIPVMAVSSSGYRSAAGVTIPEAKDREVNEREVEYALYYCRLDMSLTHSALARALRDRSLNDAERNLIVQTLARGERTRQRFYAHHTFRTRECESAALVDDQRTIARGVQKAFEQGAIDANDLLRIADANKDGSGARAFMHILSFSDVACDMGGAAEALADALWARDSNNGADRAIAAIHYASSGERMARRLTTPARRSEALDVVKRFIESDPYRGLPLGAVADAWRQAAQAAAAELVAVQQLDLIDSTEEVAPDRRAVRRPRKRQGTQKPTTSD